MSNKNHSWITNNNVDIIDHSIDMMHKMSRYTNNIFVIKCGNNHIKNPSMIDNLASNIVMMQKLGINVIIVHGGGPQIGDIVQKLNLQDQFIDEHRVTDEKTFSAVEMVLCGRIGVDISAAISKYGGQALSISGRDCSIITADKIRRIKKDEGSNIEKIVNLGVIGEPIAINNKTIMTILNANIIPVIAPIGISKIGNRPYVLNADIAAGFIASSLSAHKLFILSDVDGIHDEDEHLITEISTIELHSLMHNINLPSDIKQKALVAIQSTTNGTHACHIINGCIKNAIIMELTLQSGIGTTIHHSRYSKISR